MKVQTSALEKEEMNGLHTQQNGCANPPTLLSLKENGICNGLDIKKEPDEEPINGIKRKYPDDDSFNSANTIVKRIKEEHLYIKPETEIKKEENESKFIKTEKEPCLYRIKLSDVDEEKSGGNVPIGDAKLQIILSGQTRSMDTNTVTIKKTEKTQSKITSFFTSPSKTTLASLSPPKSPGSVPITIPEHVLPPYPNYYVCCNCTYYKILRTDDLQNHSKFHNRIEKLNDFNNCKVMLKEPKVYNSDEIDLHPGSPIKKIPRTPVKAQSKSSYSSPMKSPKKNLTKSPTKSSPMKKWNDKTQGAKVLKTLTKEPQLLMQSMHDLIRQTGLNKKKVIPEMLISFVVFIQERHSIWERRHNKLPAKSWTQNKILKEHWFTNIYRELDRGTAFLKRNLHETVFRSRKLEPLNGANYIKILKRVLIKCFSYRLVNRLDTFLEFGKLPDVGDYEDWEKFLRYKYQLKGEESIIFTRAHQNNGLERYFKSMEYVKSNLTSMAKELMDAASERSLKKCFYILKDVPGAGKFMSWQILCDLLELRLLGECTDNQWTCLGPGARAGLGKIFKESKPADELSLTRQLRNLCQASGDSSAYEAMGMDPPLLLGKEVSLKNIEHALCEFDKYVRFATDQGVRQRRFNKDTSSAHYDKLTQKCPECYTSISIVNEGAKPNSLKAKHCPLCNRLYHNGCTSKRHKQSLAQSVGIEKDSVWICPSCLPMVDCWQKEDYYFDEPSDSKSPKKRSPKKKGISSDIKKFVKKLDIEGSPKKVSVNFPIKDILIMDLADDKEIDTITLSDTDDSEEKHSIQYSPQKKRKMKSKKSSTKNISLVASKMELHDVSDDEGREQEKENIANEINGDTDDDVEYVDEKEKIFRDKIRALPLF